MDIATYAARRGVMTELARAIGVSRAYVSQIVHGETTPTPERAAQIEVATGGAVRRWDLRPDDWHRIWPEMIGAEGAPPRRARVAKAGRPGAAARRPQRVASIAAALIAEAFVATGAQFMRVSIDRRARVCVDITGDGWSHNKSFPRSVSTGRLREGLLC